MNYDVTTTLIELEEFCIAHGIISSQQPGSLDVLCSKSLECYLAKQDALCKNNNWEVAHLSDELIQYAALDVYALRLIFEKASENPLIKYLEITTAPRT